MTGFFGFNPSYVAWIVFCGFLSNTIGYSWQIGVVIGMGLIYIKDIITNLRRH